MWKIHNTLIQDKDIKLKVGLTFMIVLIIISIMITILKCVMQLLNIRLLLLAVF